MAYPTYRENYQRQWQERRNLWRDSADPQVHRTGKIETRSARKRILKWT
jgi:hypothetical protein